MSAVVVSLGRDARVIALIGFAHAVSHFFHLLLPPLFPWLKAEFGLDYLQLGGTMTVFFACSATGQALAGFLVDRLGALRVLLAGMSLFLLAGIALALAGGYPGLLLAAALAGCGNAVFHPADFTVLNRSVSPGRLSHAFSVHGLSGNLGWAAAPLFLTALAGLFGWRTAALAAGLMALPAMALLLAARRLLVVAPVSDGHAASGGQSPLAFLRDGAVWLCFAFFFLITAAFGAIQSFSPAVLGALYGLSVHAAAATLSGYLLASGAGIVVGGFIAQHRAHERIIAVVLGIAALLALLLASQWLAAPFIPLLFAAIGFFSGSAGPSRDLLVRRAAMARFGQAAYGRIYGFVYSGLDLGLALAPLLFGLLMDREQFAAVLVGVAVFQSLAILTALRVGRGSAAGVTGG